MPMDGVREKITIAAIIPLYNGGPFIREALESVLNQTTPPDEILVVDDGSTDDGPAIVAQIAAVHPVQVFRKENGGQSSARNFAIARCKSSHVALLDQDDAWYCDHLEILRVPFEEPRIRDLALVYGNLDQIDRAGRMVLHECLNTVPTPQPKTSLLQCLQHEMFILPGASLFCKKAFDAVGGFDERLSGYEDDDLFLRMFTAGYRSVYINKAVSRWRIYSGSTSFSPRMARSRLIYFQKLIENNPDDERLNCYWGRDVIGPRFAQTLLGEFIRGSQTGDVPRMKQAWSDLRAIVPVMRRKSRRRFAIVAPLVDTLYRNGFSSVACELLRFAFR